MTNTSLLLLEVFVAITGAAHAAAAFFYFSRARHAAVWAAVWSAFTVLCVWQLEPRPALACGAFAAAVVLWTAWWWSIRALASRDWVIENARQATGEIAGDRLTIHDLRNFTWRGRHDFDARWEDRTWDLTKLTALDLFVCTWAEPQVAHLIVSFVFGAAPPLAFSIETRREKTEKWTILAGFMKSYELIIVAADERDVVRVRTNVRGEMVRRYRITSTPGMRRKLLARYVRELNDVAARPRFYNTVFRNCATEVVRILRAAGRPVPFDWRILVSGFVPEYLYALGLIETPYPFEDLQRHADIRAAAHAASDDRDFSGIIRGEAPVPGA